MTSKPRMLVGSGMGRTSSTMMLSKTQSAPTWLPPVPRPRVVTSPVHVTMPKEVDVSNVPLSQTS